LIDANDANDANDAIDAISIAANSVSLTSFLIQKT
jgi:hypothetical protein